MAEKVTMMRLKVDLQCHKCYNKVKNVLCKFPQIRNQVYDEKNNIVTITVVCCNPEKIRDKLCCKGCGAIKSIEIVEPTKPKTLTQDKPKKTTNSETPPPTVPVCPPPAVLIGICCGPCRPAVPIRTCCGPCSEGRPGGPCFHGYGGPAQPEPKPESPPPRVPVRPPPAVPIRTCCGPCSEGRPGGPCFHGYGGSPPCYESCYGYGSCGGGRPCYVSNCGEYSCEEDPSACTIM